MTKRTEKAIDIFLDAINNGTLAKGRCSACAVGNLVADGMGISIDINNYGLTVNGYWKEAFHTAQEIQMVFEHEFENPKVIECVEATDFTLEELMQIEEAFECNTKIHGLYYDEYSKELIRADQIKGLEAVVKVMLTFDEDKDSDVKEIFTSKAEVIPV